MAIKPLVAAKASVQSPRKIPENSKDKVTDMTVAGVFSDLLEPHTSEPETAERKPDFDGEVAEIFSQAKMHRERLITFFIRYTWVFSLFVALIITAQALARAFLYGKEAVELIPHWALNLLVVGLIGQFITLLTIVTKKVWLFEAFFKHADTHHAVDGEANSNPTTR